MRACVSRLRSMSASRPTMVGLIASPVICECAWLPAGRILLWSGNAPTANRGDRAQQRVDFVDVNAQQAGTHSVASQRTLRDAAADCLR